MSWSINADATVEKNLDNGSVSIANAASGHNVTLSPDAAAALLSESEDTSSSADSGSVEPSTNDNPPSDVKPESGMPEENKPGE
jgi:hypothetical protein